MEKRKNINEVTSEVLKALGRTWDDVISTTFVYVPKIDGDTQYTVRGINLQLFGHLVVIVPDESKVNSYHMYTSKTTIDRNHIIYDLIDRGYNEIQVAKMMKCSTGTVSYVVNNKPKNDIDE